MKKKAILRKPLLVVTRFLTARIKINISELQRIIA